MWVEKGEDVRLASRRETHQVPRGLRGCAVSRDGLASGEAEALDAWLPGWWRGWGWWGDRHGLVGKVVRARRESLKTVLRSVDFTGKGNEELWKPICLGG